MMESYNSKSKQRAQTPNSPKAKNESEGSERFIANEKAKLMLSTALGRTPKLPICRQLYTTHAAGAVAAALAVRMAKDHSIVIYNLTDIWCGEVYLESNFTDKKISEHSAFLDLLLQMMKFLGMQDKQASANILNEIIRRLPRRSLLHYWNNTELTWKILTEIRRDMDKLMLTMKHVTADDRKEQIRFLLENIVPRLRDIRAMLKQIMECLDAVTEHIKADWNEDVKEISQQCMGI